MPRQSHLLRNLFLLMLTTIAGGTVGYVRIEEGWTLFDAFYMTIITLTTIGFTEVHGLSDGGRLFTVILIVCGLGAAATFVTQFAQVMVESNVRDMWRKRRMEKQLTDLKDHVIICGYGRIGQAIGADLHKAGIPCVVLDANEKRIAAAQNAGLNVMAGNATCDLSLVSAGIERAAVLVAALSQDADNVFVALAARDLNRDIIVIARTEDRSLETRMLRAGVNRVVCPAYLGGGQIARMIGQDLGLNVSFGRSRRATDVLGYELSMYRNLEGRSLRVSEILATTGALQAVALVPAEGDRVEGPGPEAVVRDGDAVALVVACKTAGDEAKPEAEAVRRERDPVTIPSR
ncbi:MAG: potassium channel family protein [bacterium]|nr:potassium channel family protein [bacterium]